MVQVDGLKRTSGRQPIIGLDFLRLAAALLVMTYHLAYGHRGVVQGVHASLPFPSYPSLTPFTWFGWVGVDIFFVISGFVILYSAPKDSFSFFKARFLRLFPGALVCASISAATLWWFDLETAGTTAILWLRTVLFVPYPPWVDQSYWTLSIEISFYSVIIFLIFMKKFYRIDLFLILIGLFSSIYWITQFATNQSGWPLPNFPGTLSQLLLFRDGCSFAIGGLLWVQLFRKGAAYNWLFIALFAAIGFGKISVAATNRMTLDGMVGPSHFIPSFIWLVSLVFIWASAKRNELFSAVISPDFARACGIATYPLYLLHDVVGVAAITTIFRFCGNGAASFALAIAIIIAATYFVAQHIEPRVREKLKLLIFRS